MVSTYSPILRIELIGTGDQSGVWGLTTNRNLGTLLENAISGRVVVPHTDAASITLTTNNGVADQARPMILSITGILTADREVICPTLSKRYILTNDTTGGFSITIKTAAGTGVAVPPGAAFDVFCDGTNVRPAETLLSSAGFAAGSVTTPALADGAVTSIKLGAGAVETANILNAAVTNAKLANMPGGAIKLRNSLSAGVPQDVLITGLTEVSSVADTSRLLVQLSTGEFRGAAPSAIVAASSLVPPATVSAYANTTAPTGWYLCDGTSYPRAPDDQALYDALNPFYQTDADNFVVPDLRGEFVRGFDAGRGIDAGRAFGTAQSDEIKAHSHTFTNDDLTPVLEDSESTNRSLAQFNGTEQDTTDDTGGAETRPRNIALSYIIKR